MKNTERTAPWSLKVPVWSLAGYVCILYPLVHWVFREPHRLSTWLGPVYFGGVLIALLASGKVTLPQLGIHAGARGRDIAIGLVPAVLVVMTVPLLDWFIEASGLAQSELFAGAENRRMVQPGLLSLLMSFAGRVLAVPFVEQLYFTGFLLPALFRVVKPMTAIYIAAAVFTLVHFELKLSLFLIGLICSGFYYWTGSLWASVVFHAGCALGGMLVAFFYPRVVTFLAFLL